MVREESRKKSVHSFTIIFYLLQRIELYFGNEHNVCHAFFVFRSDAECDVFKRKKRTLFNANALVWWIVRKKVVKHLSHIANLWHNNNRRLDMVGPRFRTRVRFFSACSFPSKQIAWHLLLSEMFEQKSIKFFLRSFFSFQDTGAI